jgi:hypothetical protein
MRNAPTVDPLINAVRVADLRTYLLGRGWKIKPFPRSQVIYFEGPLDDEGKPITLLVPASERLRDYELRVSEIIEALSAIEGKPEAEIARSVITPTCDILNVRLEGEETRTGTLGLRYADKFLVGVRNLLIYAACVEIRSRSFYEQPPREPVRFAHQCRFRPVSGSFTAQIEVPLLPPVTAEPNEQRSVPRHRLFTLSLMRSLSALQTVIGSSKEESPLDRARDLLNANLCEALLKIRPQASRLALEVGVTWSSEWAKGESLPTQPVRFEDRDFASIEAVGQELRFRAIEAPADSIPLRPNGQQPVALIPPEKAAAQVEASGKPSLQGPLVGRILGLSRDGDPGPFVVTLQVVNLHTLNRVDLSVSAEQYRLACDAHRDDQLVEVDGVLDWSNRGRWRLFNIRQFRVKSQG